jgi:hypothetical protein
MTGGTAMLVDQLFTQLEVGLAENVGTLRMGSRREREQSRA